MLGMDFLKMRTVLRHYRKDVWPGKPLNRDFTVSRLDEFVKKELPSYGGVFGDHYTRAVRAFDQLMEKYVSIHTDHVQAVPRAEGSWSLPADERRPRRQRCCGKSRQRRGARRFGCATRSTRRSAERSSPPTTPGARAR